VTGCCDLALELSGLVETSPVLEATAPAPTNVVCFRFRPSGWADGNGLDDLNRRIQAAIAAEGHVFHTGAQLANGFSQRAAIVSWRTTSADVQALAEAVERHGRGLA
jgi:glutamate/tyrosine decarboxylase-like PLP-dependent enzyme